MWGIVAEAIYVLVIYFIDSEQQNTSGFFAPLTEFVNGYSFMGEFLVIVPVLGLIILITAFSAHLPSKLLFAHTRNYCAGLTTRERHAKQLSNEDEETMMVLGGIHGDAQIFKVMSDLDENLLYEQENGELTEEHKLLRLRH